MDTTAPATAAGPTASATVDNGTAASGGMPISVEYQQRKTTVPPLMALNDGTLYTRNLLLRGISLVYLMAFIAFYYQSPGKSDQVFTTYVVWCLVINVTVCVLTNTADTFMRMNLHDFGKNFK